MGVFHSAATRFIERERVAKEGGISSATSFTLEPHLPTGEWIKAVIKGADERSQPSRHVLLFGGLLIGFANKDDEFLSSSLGLLLQTAFVKAVNLTLMETPTTDELSLFGIVLALNHAFTHLSDMERSKIDYDRLLPILMASTLHSSDGLQSGYFLGVVDADVQQVSSVQFSWTKTSSSFRQVERTLSSPLASNLGPLSRLIAHTVEQVHDSWLLLSAIEDLADFSRRLLTQWRQNKLSEIDASEEAMFLHEEARKDTVPTLWKLLRSTLFAVVIVLRSAIGRVIGDGILAANDSKFSLSINGAFQKDLTCVDASHIAQETLHALRSLSFIHSRLGSAAFSQYTFTYLAAIDILATYPSEAEAFLQSIAPSDLGRIPGHPLERCLDLFFLNTAEQFTLGLSPHLSEEFVITAATPYLITDGNQNLLPMFEAAHSIMLAVFSAPQNVEITAKHLPFYVDSLFRVCFSTLSIRSSTDNIQVFPHNLSPRQFRLAFKNLIRVTSPPSRIAAAQPMLAATLLELVHERALHAPVIPLSINPGAAPITSPMSEPDQTIVPQLSEQAVLVFTLTDALPHLSLDLLGEWLPIVATLLNHVMDPAVRDHCKRHFWDTLVGGEMDPERSQVCVVWWTSRGGREIVLYDDQTEQNPGDAEYMMTGALSEDKPLAKL